MTLRISLSCIIVLTELRQDILPLISEILSVMPFTKRLDFINPISFPIWDPLICSCPSFTVFHNVLREIFVQLLQCHLTSFNYNPPTFLICYEIFFTHFSSFMIQQLHSSIWHSSPFLWLHILHVHSVIVLPLFFFHISIWHFNFESPIHV